MNRWAILFSLALGLGGASCEAAALEFRCVREVVAPAFAEEELLAVPLDADVYNATQDQLPDLRLLDGRGDTVPFMLRQSRATQSETVRQSWPVRPPAARPLGDGGLEITLALQPDDPRPNGLRIVTRLKNFEQRVQVFSSSNGVDWQSLGEESLIWDYSRYVDVRRDTVSFPETPDRQFRIVIDRVTAEQESELLALTRRLRGAEETEREEKTTIQRRPFRIERIDFWRETEQLQSAGVQEVAYPVAAYRVEQELDNQQTMLYVDTRREPLTSLALETSDRNFSRRAVVQVPARPGVLTSWRNIGSSTLTRIDFKGLRQVDVAVRFPQTRQVSYRLVIDNRDSPPLQVTGVQAKGNVYELLFLAQPNTRYQLRYGSPTAEAPRYDTAAIRQVLDAGFQPTLVQLGAVGPTADVAQDFQWSSLLNNRGLLLCAIALLVFLLAWGLYRAVQRVDDLPNS